MPLNLRHLREARDGKTSESDNSHECARERRTEREVNLSVVGERGERGGQQVVGSSPLASSSPPLPHLFIYC